MDNSYNQVGGVAQAMPNNLQDDNNFNPEYIFTIAGHVISDDGVYLCRRTKKKEMQSMSSNHQKTS